MATSEQIDDALARYALAEKTASAILFSDTDREILDSYATRYREEQQTLAGIWGGNGSNST